ncbi:MAG: mobilization protein [Jannaschia sp.]
MAETELERAEKRYEQAKARLQALRNRETTRQRKMDTRRKVILGGALMDLAERDTNAASMMDRLVRNLPRDQDRKAFDGWTLQGTREGGTSGVGGGVGVETQTSDREGA